MPWKSWPIQVCAETLNENNQDWQLEDKEQFLKAYKFLQQRGFDHQDAKEIIKLVWWLKITLQILENLF